MQDFRMETFLTVCEVMNFTKAAALLNLTQPAVSQHIRFLEQAYQADLFSQNGKKLSLTPAGKILYHAALTMRQDEQHMKMKILQAQDRIQNYSFGATLTVAEFILEEDLKAFLADNPKSHVRMLVENTTDLLKKLDSSEIDFAIVEGEFPRDTYECLPYARETYVAAAAPQKAALYQNALIQDLLGETLILREPGSGTREILESRLREQGIRTDQFANWIELGNIGAINALLKAGLGITFCYHSAIQKEVAAGELSLIPLQDLNLTHEIMFIFRKGSIFREDYVKIYHKLCRVPCKSERDFV